MGSILTTPNQRKGYTKSGSSRMKISGKNTWKREVDYGIRRANEGSQRAQDAINRIHKDRSEYKQFIGHDNYWKKPVQYEQPKLTGGQDSDKSIEPTRGEISRAVRRLEDNPGLHQAYVGKSSGSQSVNRVKYKGLSKNKKK